MKVEIKEDERIDDLEYKNLKIIQNKNNFCFGIDSVLLSDFAKEIKKNSTVLDLGTGNGIVAILLAGKTEAKKIVGIEIQEDVAEMAQRSVKMNNLEDRIEIINENIKKLKNIFGKGTIDSIVTNPPYKKDNTGSKNINKNKLISRHEVECNLEDVIKVTAEMLKEKGSMYMVHRPDRLVDIIDLLRKYKLEPKEIKLVYPTKIKEPNLLLIKAVKKARPFLKMDKPLFVYDEKGNYTKEILKIYNKEEK